MKGNNRNKSGPDQKLHKQSGQPFSRFEEGKDYYFNEQGLLVLTASFHLNRGYCCGNGCRHCPYPD